MQLMTQSPLPTHILVYGVSKQSSVLRSSAILGNGFPRIKNCQVIYTMLHKRKTTNRKDHNFED